MQSQEPDVEQNTSISGHDHHEMRAHDFLPAPGNDESQPPKDSKARDQMTERETREVFKGHYMQQAALEFAEDLDRIRRADDFHGDALTILIDALQQGTTAFPMGDKEQVVGIKRR